MDLQLEGSEISKDEYAISQDESAMTRGYRTVECAVAQAPLAPNDLG
jgi:hypothetical protein